MKLLTKCTQQTPLKLQGSSRRITASLDCTAVTYIIQRRHADSTTGLVVFLSPHKWPIEHVSVAKFVSGERWRPALMRRFLIKAWTPWIDGLSCGRLHRLATSSWYINSNPFLLFIDRWGPWGDGNTQLGSRKRQRQGLLHYRWCSVRCAYHSFGCHDFTQSTLYFPRTTAFRIRCHFWFQLQRYASGWFVRMRLTSYNFRWLVCFLWPAEDSRSGIHRVYQPKWLVTRTASEIPVWQFSSDFTAITSAPSYCNFGCYLTAPPTPKR